ncbi:hypothetical protein HK104_010560 [Borealophlyctis nickersoniae]|nr:hypothetical protein HK104_010560 [Borealophlyctis nickersoniae]
MARDATKPEQLQQTQEPVVFLWSVRRQNSYREEDSSAFDAFGNEWHLSFLNCKNDGFGVAPRTESAVAETTLHCAFVREDLLGPDLARYYVGACQGLWWDYSGEQARQLGDKDSFVVGVAIYPPGTPKSDRLYLPPRTATSAFLYQAEGSDVTFIVEDQEIPGHATVLRNVRAGRYFIGLLAHPFKEKIDGKVHIDGVTHKIFKAILEYVYTGRTSVDSVLELWELYRATDRFQVTTLLPYIKSELFLSLTQDVPSEVPPDVRTPQTILTLLAELKAYPDLSDLRRLCAKCLVEIWGKAKASETWRELNEGTDIPDLSEVVLDAASEMFKAAAMRD